MPQRALHAIKVRGSSVTVESMYGVRSSARSPGSLAGVLQNRPSWKARKEGVRLYSLPVRSLRWTNAADFWSGLASGK